jgi:hypothetical protein
MKTFLWLGAAVALAGLAVAATRNQGKRSSQAAGVSVAQDQDKHSTQAEEAADRKREAILAEIKDLGSHNWAGAYYSGDGRGVNVSLVIAPIAGYVFEWHGCLGLYDRNYGEATWNDGRISLSFTFQNDRKGFQGIASDFIPVAWGPRRYLIPADDIVGFCNDVNGGREPRDRSHGHYLLRRGDENSPVDGDPALPNEYQAYLLPKPVEATIIAVGTYTTRASRIDFKFKDTPVTIDTGARQGLRVGMELFVITPDDMVESIKITKVDEARSEAVMIQIGEEEPGPQIGWRVSTRAPWYVEEP